MHILHIIQRYYPYIGGSELYFQELSEQFASEGHQVTVLTTDAWDLDHFWAAGRRRVAVREEIHNGVQIRRFPVMRAPGPSLVYPILRRLMVELGRLPGTLPLVRNLAHITPRVPELTCWLRTTTKPFDVVVTSNITLDFTISAALEFAQHRRIPHICIPFVHLGEPGNRQIVRYYSQPFQIDLLRRSTRVLVQTKLEGDFLTQVGLEPRALRQVGGWVKPEVVIGGDANRFRQTYHLSAPIVLSIGTAAYDKGTMHLVEAMQPLWAQGHPAQLVLVASTTLAQWEHYWAKLPPTSQARITVIKAAPHQTKLDALAAADVFALPSRTDSFGIVFLEAWCYDLPVIGARAGGVPEVVADGQTGILVPFGEVDELGNAITTLLTDHAYAHRLGTAGHAHVLRELTFPRKFEQVKQIYEEAIAGDGG